MEIKEHKHANYLGCMLVKQKQPPDVFDKKKVFLEISQNSQENTFVRVCNFIKKEALTQLFSYKFHEIFQNTFFTEHIRVEAMSRNNVSIEKNQF